MRSSASATSAALYLFSCLTVHPGQCRARASAMVCLLSQSTSTCRLSPIGPNCLLLHPRSSFGPVPSFAPCMSKLNNTPICSWLCLLSEVLCFASHLVKKGLVFLHDLSYHHHHHHHQRHSPPVTGAKKHTPRVFTFFIRTQFPPGESPATELLNSGPQLPLANRCGSIQVSSRFFLKGD